MRWRFPPGDLTLERQLANEEWRVLKQYTGITDLRTDAWHNPIVERSVGLGLGGNAATRHAL